MRPERLMVYVICCWHRQISKTYVCDCIVNTIHLGYNFFQMINTMWRNFFFFQLHPSIAIPYAVNLCSVLFLSTWLLHKRETNASVNGGGKSDQINSIDDSHSTSHPTKEKKKGKRNENNISVPFGLRISLLQHQIIWPIENRQHGRRRRRLRRRRQRTNRWSHFMLYYSF